METQIAPAHATRFLPPGDGGRIWRRSQRRRYDVAPRRHVELVVLLAVTGKARYFIDGTLVLLGPRSLLFAHSDQGHFLVEETPGFEMIVAVIPPETLTDGHPPALRRDRGGSGADPRTIASAGQEELIELADTLTRTDAAAAQKAGLAWWLHRAWRHWAAAAAWQSPATHPGVAHALAAIRTDPGLALSAVAAGAGLSLSRLGQAFKAETGMTLGSYRTQHRLELVDRRLRVAPDVPLLTAALDAGFGDYTRFYRAFRAARGRSPRAVYKGATVRAK